MKLILTLIISLTIPKLLVSQIQLHGRILNTKNESVAFAHLKLIDKTDSALIQGAISNIDGDFIIKNIIKGHYFLVTSNVEYISDTLNLKLLQEGNQNFNIILHEKTDVLKEIMVVSKKPKLSVQKDKLSIDVENSAVSTGLNAIQLLNRSPRIKVDEQNSNLTIDGLNGVGILING